MSPGISHYAFTHMCVSPRATDRVRDSLSPRPLVPSLCPLAVCVCASVRTNEALFIQLPPSMRATDAIVPQLLCALAGAGGQYVAWTFTTGELVRSSPLIGPNGIVYVGSLDYNLYAINATDGTLAWKFVTEVWWTHHQRWASMGSQYFGCRIIVCTRSMEPTAQTRLEVHHRRWCRSSRAIGTDGIVCRIDHNHLYALNATDGTLKWVYAAQVGDPFVGDNGIVRVIYRPQLYGMPPMVTLVEAHNGRHGRVLASIGRKRCRVRRVAGS